MSAKDIFKKKPITNGFSENKRFRLLFFSQNIILNLHKSNLISLQMFKSNLLVLVFLLVPILAHSQHRALKHDDYLRFSTIESIKISDNNEKIAWLETLPKNNNSLIVYSTKKQSYVKYDRASQLQMLPNSGNFLFTRKADYNLIQKLKRQKKKTNELPTDTLVFISASGMVSSTPCLKEAKTAPFNFPWYAYTSNECDSLGFIKKNPSKKTFKAKLSNQSSPTDTDKKNNTKNSPKIESWPLTIVNPSSNNQIQLERVTNWEFSDDGAALWVVSRINDSTDSLQIHRVAFNKSPEIITKSKGKCSQIGVADNANHAAFIIQNDSIKDLSSMIVIDNRKAKTFSTPLPVSDTNYTFSKFRKPLFSKDGNRLFYGIAIKSPQTKPDSLLKDEMATLDIWHWNDNRIMPQQLKELNGDKKKSWLACLNLVDSTTVCLENDTLKVSFDNKNSNLYLTAKNENNYLKQSSWDEGFTDLYIINSLTGKSQLVTKRSNSRQYLSPNGLWSVWFNPYDSTWNLFSVEKNKSICLTRKLKTAFYDLDQDTPELASSYPFIGWGEKSDFFLIRDQYDIWKFHTRDNQEPLMVTKGVGRSKQVSFSLKQFNQRAFGFSESSCYYLEGTSYATKTDAIWFLRDITGKRSPEILFDSKCEITSSLKNENHQTLVLGIQDYSKAPQLWVSTKEKLSDLRQISRANEFADSIAWGSAHLIQWKSPLGFNLEGLVYLPENYDSTKRYPTILYFYERNSQYLHTFYTPRPSRSIINVPWFVSNGYIVFIPDIRYKTGFPGQSAYDCVMSGLDHIIRNYSIDTLNIGLQGHSWGGYQIGYIVTKTNRFKAAWAGAPVANMTSAYGGIRYESGVSRMFQYEKTQSRIGKTIWEAPNLYIENSPLFEANKIQTPLVILANDADGAVPWTQGIEFFSALRRLNKPSWLINYNGEPHNLNSSSWGNRMDLSIKLSEFFGHYLKGEPAAPWLKSGIPALKKETNGYRPTN